MATLQFEVSHVGDSMRTYTTPTVIWLRNGEPITIMPSNTPLKNGGLRTTLSFEFLESLAGVYQCMFTDPSRSEIFVPEPIRVDTGEDCCSILNS